LKGPSGNVYVPIEESKIYIKVPLNFESYNPNTKIEAVFKFITDYNTFDNIISISGLSRYNGQIVSMQLHVINRMLNVYFKAFNECKLTSGYPIYDLLYDPIELNAVLLKKLPAGDSLDKLGYARYRSKLYRLLVIEFIAYLNLQGNKRIRKNIIDMLKGFTAANIKYSDIVHGIKNLFETEFGNSDSAGDYIEDMIEISKQISTYFIQQNNLEQLTVVMDKSHYRFDQVRLLQLRTLSHNELKSELIDIFKTLTTTGDLSRSKEQFPNLYYACAMVPAMYCTDSKLIVKDGELEPLLELLAVDLLNPLKEKFFTAGNMLNILAYFNFRHSIGERSVVLKI
jgi:hypothetical protein